MRYTPTPWKKQTDLVEITYLKKADPRPAAKNRDIRDIVSIMLSNIERDGEAVLRDYAKYLDG